MIKIISVSGIDNLAKKLNELTNNKKTTKVKYQVLKALDGRRPEFVVEYTEND